MLPIEQLYEDLQPLVQAARPEDALPALQNAVRSFPDFARAHSDLGMLYYRSGDKPKALGHLERAAHLDPGNPELLKNLADYYHVELGRVEDAVALYSTLLNLRPNEVAIRTVTAHLLVGLHRFAEAAVHYRRVLDTEPWNAEVTSNLAAVERICAGRTGGEGPEGRYADARRLAAAGDLAGARRTLEALAAEHPQFAPAHNDLGVLDYGAGLKEQALRRYEEACRLQPESPTFQKNRADFYWAEQGRAEEALKIYLQVIEADPDDVEPLMALGAICASVSQPEDARVFYTRVLDIDPGNDAARKALDALQGGADSHGAEPASSPEALYAEAARLIAAGDAIAGRGRLLQLIESHPGFALAHNDLGVLAWQTGDPGAALERYETAVHLEPSNMTFQKNLADCCWVGFGRYEDALKIYVDVLSAYPEDVETLHATGKLCLELDRPGDARTFFERMLEIEPWNVEAVRELDRLDAASKAA